MTAALTLVVCGAPLAVRAPEVALALVDVGWSVTVVASPMSRGWLDVDLLRSVTGRPVLFEQRQTNQVRGPRPDAVVACPLTMNSASKAATGIMDTYATGVLVDAIAMRLPLTVVVMVSDRLWAHPAWAHHVDTFASVGARFVSPATGLAADPRPVESGSGWEMVAGFDPAGLARVVGPPGHS